MNLTEKRKGALISLTYFAVLIAAYFLFIKYVFWFLAPFIFAFVVAMFLQKPINAINKKTHINKKFVSVVFVLLILGVIFTVIGFAGYRIWQEIVDFYYYIREKFSDPATIIETVKGWLNSTLSHLPKAIENKAKDIIDNITSNSLNLSEKTDEAIEAAATEKSSFSLENFDLSTLATPLGGIIDFAKAVPTFMAAVLIGIVSCLFMTMDYDGFTRVIKNAVSEEHEKTLIRTKHIILNVFGKWCKSYATLMFITFCEVSLGLYVLQFIDVYKAGYIFIIAACTAVVDILPVFGTGTVFIPWAVICIFAGNFPLGIGLIVIYVIITVIRQIIEPKIVSSNLEMHPVITLICMYVGLQIFGFLGLIILPLTLVVIITLNREGIVHIWTRAVNPEPETVEEAKNEPKNEPATEQKESPEEKEENAVVTK